MSEAASLDDLDDNLECLSVLLQDLQKAGKLIDGVAQKSYSLEDYLDVSHFRMCVAKALTQIYELKSELYDIQPDLTPEVLRPSLAPVNFTPALERLRSEEWAIRNNTIRFFKSHMNDRDALQFAEACESGTGFELAQQWWEKQKKPFVPVIRVYRFLRHGNKFMRYHSAKLLEAIFEISLWDEEQDDVLLEVADRWFDAWQQQQ